MTKYIWQNPDWPAMRWDAERLLPRFGSRPEEIFQIQVMYVSASRRDPLFGECPVDAKSMLRDFQPGDGPMSYSNPRYSVDRVDHIGSVIRKGECLEAIRRQR